MTALTGINVPGKFLSNVAVVAPSVTASTKNGFPSISVPVPAAMAASKPAPAIVAKVVPS